MHTVHTMYTWYAADRSKDTTGKTATWIHFANKNEKKTGIE